MARKTIETFKIDYLQILDEHGKVDKKLLPKLPKSTLLNMYKSMVIARRLDDKEFSMQRQGRIFTFAQVRGQEACQVAAMECLNKDDWVVPAFREWAAFIHRGASLLSILLFNGGDERGNLFGHNILPVSIPVASQSLHAVGIAWGMKLKKEKNVTVCFFGDGATSEGDFHEALNFAGVYKVPCVFICQNNKYAISLPVEQQTASKTLAQKAIAYGIEGIKVDGNDIFAMYVAVRDAVKKARAGKGPTFIEADTYRLANHTTSDDWKRYRSAAEVKRWEKRDPILRFKNYLMKAKLWSAKDEEAMLKEVGQNINAAVEDFEKSPPPTKEDMFKYMYAEMPPHLKEQFELSKQFGKDGET